MRKIVLDQFGEAWGYAEVPENITEIKVFTEMSEGTPINARTRKVSRDKKYEQQLKQTGGYETFIPYPIDGIMYRY